MKTTAVVAILAAFCFVPDRLAWCGPPTEIMNVAGFGEVAIYAPSTPPSQVVLFVSGDGAGTWG